MAIEFNVDSQVRPYANLGAFPVTGSLKTIYIAEDTNKTYRWTGSAYVEISQSPTQTSDLTNDGENGINPFITALDIPSTLPPSGTAGGDLTGAYPNPTVHRIHGIDIQNGTPSADDVLVYGGSPAKWQHQHLNASQVDNDSSVTGANVKLALNHLDSTKVPTSRTLTINGTTQDLSADRTFTISTGITIGTTAITSGTVGRVLFEGTGNVVSESANLFWDNTNGRLGIGTSSPSRPLHVVGTSLFNNLIFNDTSAITVHTNIEVKSDNAYETGLVLRSTTGLRWQIYVNNYTSNNFIFYNYKLGAQAMMIVGGTNNVLINTTTDAGFKLDVNGTARVSGATTIGGNLTMSGSSNFISALNAFMFFTKGAGDGVRFSPSNELNNASQNAVVIMDSNYGKVVYGGGTHTFNALSINTVINNSGSYNGIVRGIFYNPTLTNLTGTTHYAFHSTSGRHRYENLPTSPTGLASGDLWNDAGTLKIV